MKTRRSQAVKLGKAALLTGLLLFSAGSSSAEGFERVRDLWKSARGTAVHDAPSSLADFRTAIEQGPGNNWLLGSAAAAAFAAHDDTALRHWLSAYAANGGSLTPENLARLSAQLRDEVLIRRLEANRSPITRSVLWMTVPASVPLVEGIAYDGFSRTLFVSSVADASLYRLAAGRAPERIALPPGTGSPMGMVVDEPRHLLWAAIDNGAPRLHPATALSGLLRLDLASAAMTLVAPPPGVEAHIGDVTVDAAGTTFAADNRSGAVYECRPGCTVLRTLVAPGALQSAQGMALSPDSRRLYVADYGYGIAVLERSTRRLAPLRTRPGVALDRIDGLIRDGDSLVAVQTGWDPPRLVRIGLDPSGREAVALTVLERSHPLMSEPTGAARLPDGSIAYVANSQWQSYGPEGLQVGHRQADTFILRIPVEVGGRHSRRAR
jgi:sugar lactone lactonase YvrE